MKGLRGGGGGGTTNFSMNVPAGNRFGKAWCLGGRIFLGVGMEGMKGIYKRRKPRKGKPEKKKKRNIYAL